MKSYLTAAHGVAEALKRKRGRLYVSRVSGRAEELRHLAQTAGVPVRQVSAADLRRLAGENRGFCLELTVGDEKNHSLDDVWSNLSDSSLVVLLDGVTDPRNLGAVIRAADQFSVDAVLTPRRRSAGRDADSLSRSSSGAVEWVPLVEIANPARTLKDFQSRGFWVWGADMAGEPVSGVNLTGRNVLVMGREGAGLHRLVKESCDELIRIPTQGRIDSLNIATAAGILMYEVRRQQEFGRLNDTPASP